MTNNPYLEYLRLKKLSRKREEKLFKLYREAKKIDPRKAGEILNRLGYPDDPLTFDDAIRELEKIIRSARKKKHTRRRRTRTKKTR